MLFRWIAKRKKQKVIKNIRKHLLFFGLDSSAWSDDEFENRIVSSSQQLRKTGFSTKQASEAMMSFGNATTRTLKRLSNG
ncbi:hypothetical protein MXL46_08255 [Heyndrickxia sporothermodurans]|uniref:hypothetical protein n=1 Tax=Heyndrickxia sporothermodurans TaxID=46224 RepID=UPI002DBDE701|nr:hypothetical protein [Heyndrickxia sporothermodurans]MEB6549087.1 hypothetical protein [Heyndrickxia sporothermodurans]